MRQGDLVPDLSLFFKKALNAVKAMVYSLLLIYFDSPQLVIQLKQTALNFRLLIQRYAEFLNF